RASARSNSGAGAVASDFPAMDAVDLDLAGDAFPVESVSTGPQPIDAMHAAVFPAETEPIESAPAAAPVATPAAPQPEAPLALNTPGTTDVPATDVQSEGLLGRLAPGLAEKVIVDRNTPQATREQYRSLAATLLDAQAESGTRVVMVASAVPSEGKT